MSSREIEIRRLKRDRPKSPFIRFSLLFLLMLMAGSWILGDFGTAEIWSERRMLNLQRFLGELRPFPLRERAFQWGVFGRWIGGLWSAPGWEATRITLALSVAAIVLAGFAGGVLSLLAARTLTTDQPYLPGAGSFRRLRLVLWKLPVILTRALFIFLRAIPEYIWAFLFLTLLGPGSWPAVLALALHNSGIIGKLTAEVIENLPPAPLAALRGLGATRSQIAIAGIFPLILPRFLLFFFYRWETCVREATVLGLLGIVSLGYWIQDARSRTHYDEMIFLVLLGAGLVLIGDLISALARSRIRNAD